MIDVHYTATRSARLNDGQRKVEHSSGLTRFHTAEAFVEFVQRHNEEGTVINVVLIEPIK